MKCPHFSKVNFQKVKQVVRNQQIQLDDQNIQTSPRQYSNTIFQIDCLTQDIFIVPQQGIDQISCLKSKIPSSCYTFSNLPCKQQSIRQNNSQIIMPKQMKVKKMIVGQGSLTCDSSIKQVSESSYNLSRQYNQNQNQLFDQKQSEEGQIPSEHQFSVGSKNPHILISKISMMSMESFQIYNGLVYLSNKLNNMYQCQLKDFVIKISKQSKVKYFIELQKVKVKLLMHFPSNERQIKLSLICKTKTDQIDIYFVSCLQKQIFCDVFRSNIQKIQQKRKSHQLFNRNKQNIKSPWCSAMQNEESQILNQIQQQQQSQVDHISDLSLSSYLGDSLVFETQRMLFSQVLQNGNTFDILLFKNKSLISKMQRIFTNSDYDHTAMLLRTANNDLLMLQATSNSGVAIYTFNSLLRIDKNKYFSRIGIRKYSGQKNFNKISRLQQFIRKTVGKKYKFDPMYLIKSQANQQKDTFFCSQLVAQALQDVGILSNQTPSFKYLPKHFAEQNLNNQVIDAKFSDIIILE